MAIPVPKVEIAFTTTPEDPSPVWVNVTQYVRSITGISVTRGRQDQYETVQPSRMSLTLINDGRFTPGNVSSPHSPNVKKGRKIRVLTTLDGFTTARFTGFIDEWPVTWADASASVADVTITASSRTARLGRGRILPSIVEIEYLQDSPLAYYPLGEDEGTSRAGNVSETPRNQMAITVVGGGNTGNISFGSATGPGTDGLTAALFTRVSATAGANLVMTSPTPMIEGSIPESCTVLECFFLTNSAQEMGLAQADQVGFFPGQVGLFLGTNSTGKLIGVQHGVGSPIYTLTSTATVSDGATHHAAIKETVTAGTFIADLFLDGVQVATTSIPGWESTTVHRLIGGGGVFNSCYAGTLSHVALTWSATEITDDRILQHALSGLTGFSGESSNVRIVRLGRYAGIPITQISGEAGSSTSIVNQETTGQTPLSLMQDVIRTESGVLFDGREGLLTFHSRSHRYNSLSELTLYAAGGELQANLEPRLDDQGLVNDVTASRAGGVSVRAVDTASVDEYGTYREEIQLITTLDTEVEDAASWKVFTASTPQVAVPVAEVDLGRANSTLQAAILALEIGDRITLANLPSQAPQSSMDFFIEGYSERITAETHRIAFNLSPATLSGVWVLDSSVYSVLGVSTRLAY